MSGVSEPLSRVKVGTLRRPEGPPEPMVVVPVDVEKEDVRILKVCFYSNSFNPGKNFKLVKCTVQTEIQVSVAGRTCSLHASVSPSPSWAAEQPSFSPAGSPVAAPWAGDSWEDVLSLLGQASSPGLCNQPPRGWGEGHILGASCEPQIICLILDSIHFISLKIYGIWSSTRDVRAFTLKEYML